MAGRSCREDVRRLALPVGAPDHYSRCPKEPDVTLVRTHTRTYALMNAWAETTPHVCPPGCDKPHAHVDDLCDAPQCVEPLKADEVCYSVTELDRDEAGREPWVCWRHVRPDDGPIRVRH